MRDLIVLFTLGFCVIFTVLVVGIGMVVAIFRMFLLLPIWIGLALVLSLVATIATLGLYLTRHPQ